MSAAQHRPAGVAVWHLIGDQGTGKSFYLQHLSKALSRRRSRPAPVIEVEGWELGQVSGRVDLVLEDRGPCSVVAITYNHIPEGQPPSYWMKGDRILSFPKGVKLDVIAAAARMDAALLLRPQGQGGAE